jgi:hypothetical protein
MWSKQELLERRLSSEYWRKSESTNWFVDNKFPKLLLRRITSSSGSSFSDSTNCWNVDQFSSNVGRQSKKRRSLTSSSTSDISAKSLKWISSISSRARRASPSSHVVIRRSPCDVIHRSSYEVIHRSSGDVWSDETSNSIIGGERRNWLPVDRLLS